MALPVAIPKPEKQQVLLIRWYGAGCDEVGNLPPGVHSNRLLTRKWKPPGILGFTHDELRILGETGWLVPGRGSATILSCFYHSRNVSNSSSILPVDIL
jgi:hypothetical protein